jgi:predicted acyl esterase
MIKIHSTWFPLIDRNPQKFIEIPKAQEKDYQKAKHSVFLSGTNTTFLELPIVKH